MPQLEGVLETALYVDDKPRSVAFFRDVMGMTIVRDEDRLTAFDAGGQSILLVFARQASLDGEDTPGGHIPGHDGTGPLHMAFKVAAGDYEAWRDQLRSAAVPELSEVTWPTGGRSYYFNDPDGHVLEIATPGLWPSY